MNNLRYLKLKRKALKVRLISVNKTSERWIKEGCEEYIKRLRRYLTLEVVDVEPVTSGRKSQADQKAEEGRLVLKQLKPGDFLILLDEQGRQNSSEEMADWINKKFVSVSSDIVFVIGGPYGFDDQLLKRANEKISLSKMTFTHQMVRLFFLEQLYRSMTILKNEPYHHS